LPSPEKLYLINPSLHPGKVQCHIFLITAFNAIRVDAEEFCGKQFLITRVTVRREQVITLINLEQGARINEFSIFHYRHM
jgi:hypothetical protein